MTDNLSNEIGQVKLAEAILEATIEIQTIYQLLVKHNIVTREEVAEMRQKVSNQPKYREMRNCLTVKSEELSDSARFEDLFEKSLQPRGRESLTPEERQYLLDRIHSMTEVAKNQNPDLFK